MLAAVRFNLNDAALGADDVRTVSVEVRAAEVWSTPDGTRTHAVLRVRAVTEDA